MELQQFSPEYLANIHKVVREVLRRERGDVGASSRWHKKNPGFRYVELEQELGDATTGLEASPPSATAAYMRFADDGKLEKSEERITVINRGRGIAYESGTRGYVLALNGEPHFIPIECDPGSSSSSSAV